MNMCMRVQVCLCRLACVCKHMHIDEYTLRKTLYTHYTGIKFILVQLVIIIIFELFKLFFIVIL
jgi:hypothetical protein